MAKQKPAVDPYLLVAPMNRRYTKLFMSYNRRNLVHVADGERTLCGRECDGWDMPFRTDKRSLIEISGPDFCRSCVKIATKRANGQA